ncbi:hypothetical protein G647_07483 [Cladophialophora carrionii CBS 160.54]|uniref:Uncharacterized protein n=1 Tax=Cladophialophora carrionii CBS 160.54 TaxID=1279043 RepID=V9D2I4_9EURO|nr:uncharacterized protein G647_07483 [Cladophialophora carrionii CBS 160.54]ETI21139.1 hypothetical protein G647_07483 [Cladophialophora carrionii CBS 160.54]
MSNRRTSSDRPRGWSQESGSSQDEVIVYQGNRMAKLPERQPTVPPSGQSAQKDEGFARFLKKHSSPTHQRVTTGGRIVPMEQRPPFFSLQHPSQDPEDQKKSVHEEAKATTKPTAAGLDQAKPGVPGNSILQPQPQPFMPVSNGVMDAATFAAGTEPTVVASTIPLGFDAIRVQPNYLQAVTASPFYAGMPGDPYSLMPVPSQMYPGSAVPFAGFNGGVGPTFSMPFIPNPQVMGFPPSCGITTTPTVPQLPSGSFDEHMLNESIELFQNLGEQLKALDRHRAMNDRDPYVVDQRKAIVQLRAEAKNQITYWSEKLGQDPHAMPKNSSGAPNGKLNVQATSYVPLRVDQAAETLPDTRGSSLKPKGISQGHAKPDFVVDSTRRPIPIVPPPEKLSTVQGDGRDGGSKSESVEVDEWGVRVGPAPPEIQRQQNEMLREIVRQASISPLGSSENAIVFTPQGSHVITPTIQPHETKEARTNTDSGTSDWLPTNPGRAPPTVEACYEVQLDAMRLPIGVVTKVRLPDGTIIEVRGCGLKRPPSFEMDEFEQRYWTTKPKVTKEMFENFVEVRADGGNDAPADIATYCEFMGLESSSVHMGKSDTSDKQSSESMHATKDLTNAQDMLREISGRGYSSTIEKSNGSGPRLSSLKLSSASSPPIWSRADDKVGWFANEHPRSGRLTGSETHSSKGISSVSVQKFHAMGRLPHVDGPSDGQRVSAVSMLAAANKAVSPQPAPRSVPSSESVYGSYGQEDRGVSVVSDDVFRTRMRQEESM